MSHLREPGSSALHGGCKLVCLGLERAQESPDTEGKAPIWGYRILPPPSPPSAILGT